MSWQVSQDIQKLANSKRAKFVARYFKTGPGEYAQGDKFLGLTVPQVRTVTKKYISLPFDEIIELLHSEYHEERQAALFILVDQFRKGDDQSKKKIYELYLQNTKYINNWDLVDLTAPVIIGGYLTDKDKKILVTLAKSQYLWERRISILATFWFLRLKNSEETLRIAEILLHDKHDLIHKAVGWGLREVGKWCGPEVEEKFLMKYAPVMPRTMLRYAIEKFDEQKRKKYLQMKNT